MQMISKAKHLMVAMRIKQWVKNLFIFAAIFFAGKLLHFELLLKVSTGFFLFGLAASGIYIFNDIHDVENDRTHPVKKNRPSALSASIVHI